MANYATPAIGTSTAVWNLQNEMNPFQFVEGIAGLVEILLPLVMSGCNFVSKTKRYV